MLARTTELVVSVCGSAKIVATAIKYPNAPATIVEDRWPGQGPLGGIVTALRDAKENNEDAEWALIVSCDMPFLTAEWLRDLCTRAEKSGAEVIAARSPNGLEPLCACWRLSSQLAVEAAFGEGVRKVTEAMRRLRMEVLDEAAWKRFDSEGRLFWNMNTPADYEEARRIVGGEQR